MNSPPFPLLTTLLASSGLDPADAPFEAEPVRAALDALEAQVGRLVLELDDSRRSYRYAADALTRANRRLREERDRLEFRVAERTAQLEASRVELLEAQRLAGLGSWTLRLDDEALEVSEPLARRLGIDTESTRATLDAIVDRVVPEDRDAVRRALRIVHAAPRRLAGELRLLDAQGEVRWFAATLVSRTDADGRVARLRGTLLDVSDRRRADERLQRLARHDDLTGLPNRAAFRDELDRAVHQARARGGRFALLFLDLDGFKEINDSLGHDAGDELLQQVATRIRRCLRRGDRLARFGGDEFLVLLEPVRRRRDVESVTRKILAAVAQPLPLDGLTATVSASIGIAVYPDDGEDPRRLLKNADAAMYEAKRDGRNAMRFYAPRINASLREKVALINDLRAAVARGELGVVYQPIVAGADAEVIGVEALARWTHPVHGPVGPAVFVPLAEECGLIGAIGALVLEKACAQLVAWDAAQDADGRTPYLSVNVSPVQLRDPGFVAQLRGLLERTGVEPARLQLELTESTVMADPARAARMLRELSALGVRIALDDFGTGYSSLAYLRTFPIDCIKIDRAFVGDLMTPDGLRGAIVPAIVAIARGLGAAVVAEGVETEPQRDALFALGCSGMQGYLFSRPLPADACGERLRARAVPPAGGEPAAIVASASQSRE